MSNPKITIITPTYNVQDLVEKTILSVLNQDYPNTEYIIIDGHSTDNTSKIINKYKNKITKFIKREPKGVYEALNYGVKIATGEWILFLHAGDHFHSNNVCSKFIQELNKDNTADVYYGNYFVHTGPKTWWFYETDIEKIYYIMPIGHEGTFYRASMHKKYKYSLSYKIASDYDLLIRMYNDGVKFKKMNIKTIHFYEGGLSTKQLLLARLESLAILGKWLNEKELKKTYFWDAIKDEEVGECKVIKELKTLKQISFFKHPIKKVKKYKEIITKV